MTAATAGPISPGTTHAVESRARSLGRVRSGYPRPITTYATDVITPPPNPCNARPAIKTGIDGASPPTIKPRVNSPTPNMNGRAGPWRSASFPAKARPIILVNMKALKVHP